MTDDDVSREIDEVDDLPADPPPIRWPRTTWGAPNPVLVPSKSTPFDEDTEDPEIPRGALWSMKYRRHFHFGSRSDELFRASLGDDDDRVYVLDDGDDSYMICREVGAAETLAYYLIGRISIGVYEECANRQADMSQIFTEASELCLCSVYEATEGASNVVLIENYRDIEDVPTEYLPSSPLIEFTDE